MMKVLIINDKFVGGGAERVFVDTIKSLKRKASGKIEIYAATTDDPPAFIKDNIKEHLKLKDSKKNPFSYIFNFSNFSKLKKWLYEKKFEVIHLHNFYGSINPSILLAIKTYKKHNDCKVIQTLHDYSILCPNSSFFNYHQNHICEVCINKKIKYPIIINRCYYGSLTISVLKFIRTFVALNVLKHIDLVDFFVIPSYFLFDKALEGNLPRSKLVIIRNPISDEIKSESSKTKELIVLFVGRLNYEKGVDLLIKAFISIIQKYKQFSDWKLYIIGSGPEEVKLKSIVPFGFYNIIFLGELSHAEVGNIMSKAKILVLPSRWYENSPLVIPEAIHNGLKVLVTNHGGMKEFAELFPTSVFTFDFHNEESKFIYNLEKKLISLMDGEYMEGDEQKKDVNYNLFTKWSADYYAEQLLKLYGFFN